MDEMLWLGHAGEKGAETITLDLSEFDKTGEYKLFHMRSSDTEPYEVDNITVAGDKLFWHVAAKDVLHEGIGFAEIRLYGPGFLMKSHKYTTYVEPSI